MSEEEKRQDELAEALENESADEEMAVVAEESNDAPEETESSSINEEVSADIEEASVESVESVFVADEISVSPVEPADEEFEPAPVPLEDEQAPEAVVAYESTMTAESEETDAEAENAKSSKSKGKLDKNSTTYEILDWIRTICIGILAGVFIVVFLVQRDNVRGNSMVPTLNPGDIIFTQKLSTYFDSYKRGDIVVLDGSDMVGYSGDDYLVKRIIGLPGETVKITDGKVYIKPADSTEFYLLQENYIPAGVSTTMMDDGTRKGYGEITLADNEYFCMGDNRPVSNDSRNLGPFTEDRIKAVALFRIYPLNQIKGL